MSAMRAIGRAKLFFLLPLLLLLLPGSLLPMAESSLLAADLNPKKNLTSGDVFSWPPDDTDDSAAAHGDDKFDGGFPSLESMLQWAIGNSDPEKLKEAAEDIKHMSKDDLERRQLQLKELMEKMKLPSDAELMRIAIADLSNISASFEQRSRALNELLVLVEPIDNANDLNKLGGLTVLIQELNSSNSELRTLSAWILGKACQNNPVVQKQILEFGALPDLMKMVSSISVEEAVKALYAVSAIVRNNLDAEKQFYGESGIMMLQEVMSNSSIDVRLRRKSASLVASLAESHLQNSDGRQFSPFSSRIFFKSVVDLIESNDLDLQEKALMAIKSLLQLTTTEANVWKDFCNLDGALDRMKKQLDDLIGDEDVREFVEDMENLRKEVESLFQRKLEKSSWVPT